jgi:tetratricopeptide (TPR) repeat protein
VIAMKKSNHQSSDSSKITRLCAHCGRKKPPVCCSRCRQAVYCGKACQKAHWPKHRVPCKQAQKQDVANAKANADKRQAAKTNPAGSKAVAGMDGEECTICLAALSSLECLQLPCGHVYHQGCVRSLRTFGVNNTCPVCRAELPPGPAANFNEGAELLTAALATVDVQLRRQQYAKAAILFQQALAEDSSMGAEAHFALGVALQDAKPGAAEAAFRAAIACDKQHANSHYNLGHLLADRQDIDGAEAAWRAAITFDPQLAQAHQNLGSVLLSHRQDVMGSEVSYRTAIACDPKCSEAHSDLGRLLHDHRQDFVGAEACYRTAIACDPECTIAIYNLGLLLNVELGRHAEAEALFRRTLELAPSDPNNHCDLGQALKSQGDMAGAEGAFRAAITFDSQHVRSQGNLGYLLHYELRRHAEAEVLFRRVLQMTPHNHNMHNTLGDVLRAQGDLPGAAAAYRCALAIDPANEYALAALMMRKA